MILGQKSLTKKLAKKKPAHMDFDLHMGICFLLLLFCSLVADDGEAGANHPGTKIANAKGVALALNPEKKRIHSPRTFHACLISGGVLMANLPCIGETSQQEHGQKEYHDLLHVFFSFPQRNVADRCLFVRPKQNPALGFEPRFAEPKSAVLPLDDAGKCRFFSSESANWVAGFLESQQKHPPDEDQTAIFNFSMCGRRGVRIGTRFSSKNRLIRSLPSSRSRICFCFA